MTTASIMLRTGLPGAGKTLFTLREVRDLEEANPGTQVFYSGIPDLRVPGWVEVEDATKWHELPQGAVLIIDEAQRVFRPRHTGSHVPEHVAKLETIRHQGIRLYVITQHPKLIDPNVRRLVGHHGHYLRAFGSTVVRRHEWGEVNEDPDKSRADSIVTTVKHPTEVYSWYRSAEVHTVKRKIPVRLVALGVLPLIIGTLGYLAYSSMTRVADEKRIAKSVLGSPGEPASSPSRERAAGPSNPADWVAMHSPRVPGLLHTAPIYDAVTAPKVAPYPAACVEFGNDCRCYTEQATRLEMPKDLCLQIVERGYFVEWQEPRPLQAQQPPNRDVESPAALLNPTKAGPHRLAISSPSR